MTPQEKFYTLTGYKVMQALQRRNMESYFCATKEDALKKALELIPAGSVVAAGGSRTVADIGLLDAVKEAAARGVYSYIDRDAAKPGEEKRKCELEAFSSDFFLMSSNAITMDGVLVNIDGIGNRSAALVYGPRNVLIIAGINKLAANEEAAIARARKVAAPINAIRLKTHTPCVSTGICQNCMEDECICRHMVITRMSNGEKRIKVILVGETLGF